MIYRLKQESFFFTEGTRFNRVSASDWRIVKPDDSEVLLSAGDAAFFESKKNTHMEQI